MRFQGEEKRVVTSLCDELVKYIKQCEKESTTFAVLIEAERMKLRNKWAVEFLESKGMTSKSVNGNQVRKS